MQLILNLFGLSQAIPGYALSLGQNLEAQAQPWTYLDLKQSPK